MKNWRRKKKAKNKTLLLIYMRHAVCDLNWLMLYILNYMFVRWFRLSLVPFHLIRKLTFIEFKSIPFDRCVDVSRTNFIRIVSIASYLKTVNCEALSSGGFFFVWRLFVLSVIEWIQIDFRIKIQMLTHPWSECEQILLISIFFRSGIDSVKCFAIIIYLFHPRNHNEPQMLIEDWLSTEYIDYISFIKFPFQILKP